MTLGYDEVMTELRVSPLDLSRPELEGVMARYSTPRSIESPIAISGNALLVGADQETEARLRTELETRGWETSTCPGPSIATRCPLFVGGKCELRENADAAVVFVDTSRVSTAGVLPKLRCAADRSSPYVLVLENRINGATERQGGIVIGSGRGASAIADAVEHAHS